MTVFPNEIDERFTPLLGKFVWHLIYNEPDLREVCDRYHHTQDILPKMAMLKDGATPSHALISYIYVGTSF